MFLRECKYLSEDVIVFRGCKCLSENARISKGIEVASVSQTMQASLRGC